MSRKFYYLLDCQICGKSFGAYRPHAKTCSSACRKKLSRAGGKQKRQNVSGVTIQQLELLLEMHS